MAAFLRQIFRFAPIFVALFVASAEAQYLFVSDMDRLFVNESSQPLAADDNLEIAAKGERYTVAAFTAEFFAALKYHIPAVLNAEGNLAVFSGGSSERNHSLLGNLMVAKDMPLLSLLSAVKSQSDLTPLIPIPEGMDRVQAYLDHKAKTGRDKLSFFSVFIKDLRTFGGDLSKTIIIEDNPNAVPINQRGNLLLVARPDVSESRISLGNRDGTEHWLEPHQMTTLQFARAKYRLVRAIALLDEAAHSVALNQAKSIPEALFALQWAKDGRFKEAEVNARHMYEHGMKILEQTYLIHLLKKHPTKKRAVDYFSFKPVEGEASGCDWALGSKSAIFPWD